VTANVASGSAGARTNEQVPGTAHRAEASAYPNASTRAATGKSERADSPRQACAWSASAKLRHKMSSLEVRKACLHVSREAAGGSGAGIRAA
jgi:hypothetical protein